MQRTTHGAIRRVLRRRAWLPGWLARYKWFRDYHLVIACLIVPLAFGVVKIVRDRSAVLAEADRRADDVASIVEQHAHATFKTYELVGNLITEHVRGWSWEQLDRSDELRAYLAELVWAYPMIRGLTVIDAEGNVRASNFPRTVATPNFAARDDFIALRAQDAGTVVGQRVHSWLNPENDLLNVARRRQSLDGSFDGVVVVTALPTSFANFWERVAPDEVTLLFRADGRLLARYPTPPGDITQRRASDMLLAASRTADRGELTKLSSIDGRMRRNYFRAIQGYPIFVVHEIDPEHVLGPWRSGAIRDGITRSAAALGLAGCAILVIRHKRREHAIANLLMARTRQLSLEAERRSQAEGELSAVLRSTLDRQEEERHRISRELHDSLAQHLAVLHLGVDQILQDQDASPDTHAQAERLKATATTVSREASRLAWELRPVGLDDLGLQAALRVLAETASTRANIPIDLYVRDADRRLPQDVEAALFRATQEALTNIIKHANAKSGHVFLEIGIDHARLIIEDDGRGFAWDDDTAVMRTGRLGLLGMRERLALLGGSLEIESAPGRGAALFVEVPFAPAPA